MIRFCRTREPFIFKKPPIEKPCPVSAERLGRALAVAGFLPWIFDFFERLTSAHWWATARPGLYSWLDISPEDRYFLRTFRPDVNPPLSHLRR